MQSTNSQLANKKFALFALGFRPFFLGAALSAALSVVVWILFYTGNISNSAMNYYSPLVWHAHEMIFGYTTAVIAGFLLTAVSNWTGRMTVQNGSLFILFSLWMLARILPFISHNVWLLAGLDLLFYPYLIVAVAIPIIKTSNHRNLFVIFILLLLCVANLLMHLELLGLTENTLRLGQYFGLYLELLLIVVIAGRVFPFFTGRGVKKTFQTKKYLWLEISCFISFSLFALLDIRYGHGSGSASLVFIISIITVVLHSVRLAGWYSKQIWSVPLLWVLHVGYYFLIIGIFLKGIAVYIPVFALPALHSMTVGGLGLITLGMMARVSLGHTGRNIHKPPKPVTLMFGLVTLATLVRVIVPIIASPYYFMAMQLSTILWSLAFLLFASIYFPYWIRPRIDGKPG